MATIKGKWVFKDDTVFDGGQWYAANFTCDGVAYVAISDKASETSLQHDMRMKYHKADGTYVKVNSGAEWLDDIYRTIDFGTTEQTVSDAFLTWMTANATQDQPAGVIIKYKDTTVSIKDGQTITLHTTDKKFTEDLEIIAPESAVEDWDGTIIIEGGTISFTIEGVSYEAEDGMTWAEWVNSSYNTDGYERFVAGSAGETLGLYEDPLSSKAIAYNNIVVYINDVIVAEREYQFKTTTTGGGAA